MTARPAKVWTGSTWEDVLGPTLGTHASSHASGGSVAPERVQEIIAEVVG